MKLFTFICTCVVLGTWMAIGRHLRAEIAQQLGYFVVPGLVVATWAFLLASLVKPEPEPKEPTPERVDKLVGEAFDRARASNGTKA